MRHRATRQVEGRLNPRWGKFVISAVFATCHRPRRRGRGVESDQVAIERGRVSMR